MPRKNPAAVSLGRLGGKKKSPAQAAARRANGSKGGRPATSKVIKVECESTEQAARWRAWAAAAGVPVSEWIISIVEGKR